MRSSAESSTLRPFFGIHPAHLMRRGTKSIQVISDTEEDVAKKKSDPSEDQVVSARKDPDEWVTGDESMTGPQASYLHTLAQEAGEPVDDSLTKAEASKKIDELQEKTGRGRDH